MKDTTDIRVNLYVKSTHFTGVMWHKTSRVWGVKHDLSQPFAIPFGISESCQAMLAKLNG